MSKDEDAGRVTRAQLIREINENMAAEVELQRALAKLTRIKFDALIGVGFTELQAVLLCKP